MAIYKHEEIKELSLDDLDHVSGGSIHNGTDNPFVDSNNPWQVIDGNGAVICAFNNREDALAKSLELNLGDDEISFNTVLERQRSYKTKIRIL